MGTLNYVAVFRDSPECGDEVLWFFDRKSEGLEEPRLAAVVRMNGVQEVLNDFLSLDDGKMRVAKLHVVRSLSHDDGYTAQYYSPLPCTRRSTSSIVRTRAPRRGGNTGTRRSKRTSSLAIRRSASSCRTSGPGSSFAIAHWIRATSASFSMASSIVASAGSSRSRSMMRSRVSRSVTIEFYASLPSLAVSDDALPRGWAQIWAHEFSDAANRSRSMPWAQGVAGLARRSLGGGGFESSPSQTHRVPAHCDDETAVDPDLAVVHRRSPDRFSPCLVTVLGLQVARNGAEEGEPSAAVTCHQIGDAGNVSFSGVVRGLPLRTDYPRPRLFPTLNCFCPIFFPTGSPIRLSIRSCGGGFR
jgi:hypothetical protein